MAAGVSRARGMSVYAVHPSIAMVQNCIARLPEKTGRSLEEWLRLVKTSGPAGQAERQAWLKREHKFGTNEAAWIAARASGTKDEFADPEQYLRAAARYVEAQYAGPKEALRPLYDRLLKLGLSAGKDAKACPCQTIVPIYRKHVIAQIKPTTNTRIDLGLALGKLKKKAPKRLLDTGGAAKGDRITHRIAITQASEIDAEVKRWLAIAYELDV